MQKLRTYQVFVSHAWDYSEDYYRVVNFLRTAPNFRWHNRRIALQGWPETRK